MYNLLFLVMIPLMPKINVISYSPEALGVVSGCVFLVTCFLFIPINFGYGLMDTEYFPHNEVRILDKALPYLYSCWK